MPGHALWHFVSIAVSCPLRVTLKFSAISFLWAAKQPQLSQPKEDENP